MLLTLEVHYPHTWSLMIKTFSLCWPFYKFSLPLLLTELKDIVWRKWCWTHHARSIQPKFLDILVKLNGSVRSNQRSFKKTGPLFYKVDNFSQSNQSKVWLNGSHPSIPPHYSSDRKRKANPFEIILGRGSQLITTLRPRNKINKLQCTLITI